MVSTQDKDKIFKERKSENTNRATDTWIRCFEDYLKARDLPKSDNIVTEDLPDILIDFYVEVRKKKPTQTPHKLSPDGHVIPQTASTSDYKKLVTTVYSCGPQ